MAQYDLNQPTHRRGFIGSLAAGAATLGMATLAAPLQLQAKNDFLPHVNDADPDAWFNKINGKHRVVFDTTEPKEVFPFAWPRVFLITNEKTGTPDKDCSVVVVLRHNAIPYAMEDSIWAKYKFGEMFKIDDQKTKAAAVRNAFWKPQPGDFKVPGIGPVPSWHVAR